MPKAPFPAWIEPMRAVLTNDRFSNNQWIFEPKLDGERILTYRDGKSLTLFTRNKLTANRQYPELLKALSGQKAQSYIVDGEIVAMKSGTSVGSFSRLQQRMHVENPPPELIKKVPVIYFLFDVLY